MIGYIYSYGLSLVCHSIVTRVLRLHFPTLTESRPSEQCFDVDCSSEMSGLDLLVETDT
jgi:hypothetical protein